MGGPGSGRKKGSGKGLHPGRAPKSAASKLFIGSSAGSRARIQASMDAAKARRAGKK
jgi:hypothetical protein